MGVDYTAKTIIGIKVDSSKLYTETEVRTYDHDYPRDIRYNPIDGRKLWEAFREPIEGYDPDGDDFLGFQFTNGYEWEEIYIGGIVSEAERGNNYEEFEDIDDLNIKKVKAEMKKKLSPLKLWDEDSFGLWTVLVFS